MAIVKHPLKKEVRGNDAGIDYEPLFGYAEAVVAANLSLEKLFYGQYPAAFLGFVLAWYKNHNLVELHVRDANTKRSRKGKKEL